MAAVNTKPIWRSRTFWFNFAMSLLAVGAELAPLLDLVTDPVLQARARAILMILTIAGNFVLRLVTDTKVTLK